MKLNRLFFSGRVLLVALQALVLVFAVLPGQARAECQCVVDSMPTSVDSIHPGEKLIKRLEYPFNGPELTASSMRAVAAIAELWRANPELLVALSVKADDGMPPAQGNPLAKQRADNLAKALRAAGVAPPKIKIRPILVGGPPME